MRRGSRLAQVADQLHGDGQDAGSEAVREQRVPERDPAHTVAGRFVLARARTGPPDRCPPVQRSGLTGSGRGNPERSPDRAAPRAANRRPAMLGRASRPARAVRNEPPGLRAGDRFVSGSPGPARRGLPLPVLGQASTRARRPTQPRRSGGRGSSREHSRAPVGDAASTPRRRGADRRVHGGGDRRSGRTLPVDPSLSGRLRPAMVALGPGRSGRGALVSLVRRILHGGPLPAPRSAARMPAAPRRLAAAVMLVALVATHARRVPGAGAPMLSSGTAPAKDVERFGWPKSSPPHCRPADAGTGVVDGARPRQPREHPSRELLQPYPHPGGPPAPRAAATHHGGPRSALLLLPPAVTQRALNRPDLAAATRF